MTLPRIRHHLVGHYTGDGVVDLPLTLEKVIVERRNYVMYVNEPAAG